MFFIKKIIEKNLLKKIPSNYEKTAILKVPKIKKKNISSPKKNFIKKFIEKIFTKKNPQK